MSDLPGHSASSDTPQPGRGTYIGVLTVRWNGNHLLYQVRYHLTLSSTSVEQTFKTVDIEELFVLLRAISEQLR